VRRRIGQPVVVFALAILSVAPAVWAYDYSYLEGGYVSIDRRRNDDSGLRLAGSVSVTPRVALIGEFVDVGEDYSQLSAGALFHTPINPQWDLALGATFEQVDVGSEDDTGFGLRGGARWRQPGGRLQLEPEVRLVDVFNDTASSARLGAQFELAPQLDLAGALQGGDDDRLELGVRYRFGI